jgi:hypothetical protein
VVIVDDHLTLLVLAGAVPGQELADDVVTTSLWYLRLVAALTAPLGPDRGPGRLTRLLDTLAIPDRDAAMARILDPPGDVLEVLHPMRFAVEMAQAQRERRLNLLAAETIAAAVHHGAPIVVAAPNRGGPIEQAAHDLDVSYEVRAS